MTAIKSLQRFFLDARLHRALFALLFIGAVLLLLWAHMVWQPQEFREGQVIPYTVHAPETFDYEDQSIIEEIESDRAERSFDPQVRETALESFATFRSALINLRNDVAEEVENDSRNGPASEQTNTKTVTMISSFAEEHSIDVTLVAYFVEMDRKRFDDVFDTAETLLGTEMEQDISSEYIRMQKSGGSQQILLNPQQIYIEFLIPNLREREARPLSAEQRELAKEIIEEGSVVIGAGEIVTRKAKEQLDLIRSKLRSEDKRRLYGLGLLLLILMVMAYFYCMRFAPSLVLRTSTLTQIGILFVVFLFIGLLIGRLPFNYFYFGVSFAVASIAVVMVLIYDPRFGFLTGAGLAMILSIALHFESSLMVYTLASALLPPVFLYQGCRSYVQVAFAGAMGVMNAALAGAVLLFQVQPANWEVFVIAGSTGFAAAVVALGLLPVIETLTAHLTPGKLIDLANPENELLKRMKMEAHGTYVHSTNVADLTDEACKDIGANALLAKVGALYHDIGKLKRPGFFAENIHDMEKNPHHGLPPETSVKIIKDHVEEGLEMAKAAKLPRELLQFVAEHHGNYQIRYFFHKAQKLHQEDPEKNPEPDEAEFHYDGPLPQSREAGVMMLADVTEAVLRARQDAGADEVPKIISEIVREKMDEQQLVKSGLTIGDLEKVKSAFNRILSGQRHTRISYPKESSAPMDFHR